jgi:hypothetical protein
MPAAIAYVAQAIATYFTANSLVVAVIQVAIYAALAVGVSKVLSEKPKFGDGFNSEAGQMVVSRGSVNTDSIAYGQTRKGGTLMFLDVSGEENAHLWQAVHVIGHEVDSVQAFYLDDIEIPVASITPGGGVVTAGKYEDRVYIWWHLGTDTQMADAALMANFPDDWTASDRARGNFYFVIAMTRDGSNADDPKVFPTGAPSAVTVVFKGSKVYDPRLDSTVGGSGSHRQAIKSTWQWSDNVPLCTRDYICRGNSVNPFESGYAEEYLTINLSELAAAANRADATIEFPGDVFLKQYTCNGLLSTADTLSANLEILEEAMSGKAFYAQGQWHIFAGGYDVPTVIIRGRDFAGQVSFMPEAPHDKRYNEVRAIYQNAVQLWRDIECLARQNLDYQEDDGEYLPLTIKSKLTTHEYTAQYLSFIRLQKTRNMQAFSADMKPRLLQIRPWDTVMLDVPELLWDMDVFRVQNFKISSETGLPEVLFKEERSELWEWDPENATEREFPDATTPPLELPPAPTNLSVASQPDNIHLKWTNPALSSFEYIEVWRSTAAQNFSNATKIARGVFDSYNDAQTAAAGQFRYWVVARNRYGGSSAREPNDNSGKLGQATSIVPTMTLVPRGQCVATSSSIEKVGGSSAWDSDCYSLETFSNGVILTWKAAQTNKNIIMGLNSDPTTNQSYTSIDYAMQMRADGLVDIYESGVLVGSAGSYTTNSQFAIIFDQTTLRYMIDGVIKRAVFLIGPRTLFLDSSFNDPGGKVLSVNMAPTSPTPVAAFQLIARGNCQYQNGMIQKVGGSGAWNSDCYSPQLFNACSLKFRFPQHPSIANCLIGLNSDPTTDQNYTSLDYAFELYTADGTNYSYYIYESGVNVVGSTAASANDRYEVRYDGQWVRYYRNNTVVRQVFDPGRQFAMDSSFFEPGTTVVDVEFGVLTEYALTAFLTTGNCRVSDTNIIKQGGSSAWDSQAYSVSGYPVCHISAKANGVGDIMIGLNKDPTTDANHTSVDYAMYFTGSATVQIYLSGTLQDTYGGYDTNTELAITYDGSVVRFYKDRVQIYSVSDSGKTFFMDSSFYTPGAGLNSVNWGPTTNLATSSTAQISPNAVTEVSLSRVTGPVTTTLTGAGSKTAQIGYISRTVPSDDTLVYEVIVSFRYAITLTGTNANWSVEFCAGDGPTDVDVIAARGSLTQDYINALPDGVYRFATVVGSVSNGILAPGTTRRFGLGVNMAYAQAANLSVLIQDVTINLGVRKR